MRESASSADSGSAATAFAEPDRNTSKPVQWRWFERADKQPFFFFAGIWRPWAGDRGTKKVPNIGDHTLFSIMTTEPNAIVEPIHEKAMPVMLLTPDDVEQWLRGSSVEDALQMQKPTPRRCGCDPACREEGGLAPSIHLAAGQFATCARDRPPRWLREALCSRGIAIGGFALVQPIVVHSEFFGRLNQAEVSL